MKLTSILLFITYLQVHANGFQNVPISGKNLTLEQVFNIVKDQTGYDVLYNPDLLKKNKAGNIVCEKNGLQKSVLEICFREQPVGFIIKHNTIKLLHQKQKKIW